MTTGIVSDEKAMRLKTGLAAFLASRLIKSQVNNQAFTPDANAHKIKLALVDLLPTTVCPVIRSQSILRQLLNSKIPGHQNQRL